MSDPKLDGVLAKLRVDYAAHLPGSVAEMEELWRRLVAGEAPQSELEALVRMVHSVAGSGTTFNFPEASRVARALELLLDPFRQQGRLPDPAAQDGVVALLDELRQVAVLP